jgi:hypothetical protein
LGMFIFVVILAAAMPFSSQAVLAIIVVASILMWAGSNLFSLLDRNPNSWLARLLESALDVDARSVNSPWGAIRIGLIIIASFIVIPAVLALFYFIGDAFS